MQPRGPGTAALLNRATIKDGAAKKLDREVSMTFHRAE